MRATLHCCDSVVMRLDITPRLHSSKMECDSFNSAIRLIFLCVFEKRLQSTTKDDHVVFVVNAVSVDAGASVDNVQPERGNEFPISASLWSVENDVGDDSHRRRRTI